MTNSSIFKEIEQVPPDPLFGLASEFQLDKREEKLDLTIGVYKNEDGLVPIMKAVKVAEQRLIETEESKRYLPIEGGKKFLYLTSKLLFGDGEYEPRLISAQSLGGTGALYLAGKILKLAGCKTICLPDPSWPNHKAIFPGCGLNIQYYPHKEGMIEAVSKMHENSAVLLHASCHNPTGIDPSQEEWKELSSIMKKRSLTPLFDCAYQGLGDGLAEDAWAVRYFASAGHEMFVAHSYSKNFGLYGERSGTLFILSDEKKVSSALKKVIRTTYSNPPIHSSAIVQEILKDDTLRHMWQEELAQMRERIVLLRTGFAKALGRASILNERGMFCYLGLDDEQVVRLKKEHAIYLTGGGRINLLGLSNENIPKIVAAL